MPSTMACLLVARHVRARFERGVTAPRCMRQLVRSVLRDASPDRLFDIELAVSELVANAVEHAGTGGSVAVTVQCNGSVLVEVTDEQGGWTAPPGPEHVGGRGLGIVDSLADRWDIRWSPLGKTVWASFGDPSSVERPLVHA